MIETVTALHERGIRMGIVSDAWPTLPDLHVGIGIPAVFEVYAISAVLGCAKPDPRMYRHASDALGLEPHECLFVDDVPESVEAAIVLGYQGVMMRRFGERVPSGLRAIESLADLLLLLDR